MCSSFTGLYDAPHWGQFIEAGGTSGICFASVITKRDRC